MSGKLRSVALNDGHALLVDEFDYPWIQEWMWSRDADTGLVYRVENGEVIYLYHELVKKHMDSEDMVIVLEDESIEKVFSQAPAYEELVAAWSRCTDALRDTNFLMSDPVDTLGYVLTEVLVEYYKWMEAQRPLTLSQVYDTLSGWMAFEGTNEVDEDGDPRFYSDVAVEAIACSVLALLAEANEGMMFDYKELLDALEEGGAELEEVYELLLDIIGTYMAPKQ